MRIEDNVGIFTISELDNETNETFIGEFRVKVILSPLDILSVDRDYRELIGAINPIMASNEANNIAFALSQLRHRILAYPSFWKGDGYDGGHLPTKVLYKILDDSIACQDKFKKDKQDELEKIRKNLTKQVKAGKIKKKVVEETELTDEEE